MFARRWPAALMRSWWAVHSQRRTKLLAGATIGEWPLRTQTFHEGPASEWALRDRLSKFCLGRQKWTMAARTWLAPSPRAWATSARATLLSFNKRRLSLRLPSRPKANSSKAFKASEWEPARITERLVIQRFND